MCEAVDSCFFRRLYFYLIDYLILGRQNFLKKKDEDLICLSELKKAWGDYGSTSSSANASGSATATRKRPTNIVGA